MKRRSCVPKYIKRGEGIAPPSSFRKEDIPKQPMNFHKRDARKPRPASNKGRGHQGGWADLKGNR